MMNENSIMIDVRNFNETIIGKFNPPSSSGENRAVRLSDVMYVHVLSKYCVFACMSVSFNELRDLKLLLRHAILSGQGGSDENGRESNASFSLSGKVLDPCMVKPTFESYHWYL